MGEEADDIIFMHASFAYLMQQIRCCNMNKPLLRVIVTHEMYFCLRKYVDTL